jgi:hypothetical protein
MTVSIAAIPVHTPTRSPGLPDSLSHWMQTYNRVHSLSAWHVHPMCIPFFLTGLGFPSNVQVLATEGAKGETICRAGSSPSSIIDTFNIYHEA